MLAGIGFKAALMLQSVTISAVFCRNKNQKSFIQADISILRSVRSNSMVRFRSSFSSLFCFQNDFCLYCSTVPFLLLVGVSMIFSDWFTSDSCGNFTLIWLLSTLRFTMAHFSSSRKWRSAARCSVLSLRCCLDLPE